MKPNSQDRERRQALIKKLQTFYLNERDESLGELAAGILLDFIEKEIAPTFYNQGIKDSQALVLKTFASLSEEMEYLEKVSPKKK